ncbi:hypothetical protein P154DRAFT_526287, partial [Amniculicola lignicola CBS 123094]
MDEVYGRAHEKAIKFMDINIKRFKDEYPEGKLIKQSDVDKEKDKKKKDEMIEEKKVREDMKESIPKVETEWNKANTWPKPKWNAQTPGIV